MTVLDGLRGAFARLFGNAIGGKLADERANEFFSWFHLEPAEPSETLADGTTRHRFRPSGPDFQSLVRLDLIAGTDDRLLETELAIDRTFIDHPRQSPFARDLAKSFLLWALKAKPAPSVGPLIANIENMHDADTPVFFRDRGDRSPPPDDPTGGYLVYLGRQRSVTIPLGRRSLALANVSEPDGSHWLHVRVGGPQRQAGRAP